MNYHTNWHREKYKVKLKNKCEVCGKDLTKLNKSKSPNQRRIRCNKCKTKEHKEYIIRAIVKGEKRVVYGLTIPHSMVKKYNLYHKGFKVSCLANGKFVLYTQVKGGSRK